MSQYDQEVEKRLQALEAKAHEQGAGAGGGDVAALEAKVDELIAKLKTLRTLREGTLNWFLALPKSKWCGWR